MSSKILSLLILVVTIALVFPVSSKAICCPAGAMGCVGEYCTKYYTGCSFQCNPDSDCANVCGAKPTVIPVPTAEPHNMWCGADPSYGVLTALGCIQTFQVKGSSQIKNVIGQILSWAVGIAGVIAFLVMVYAGAMIAMAGGDPKKVKAGQELIGAAVGGLVLIVLSIVILNFLGVSILGLGNLGFNTP